MRPNIHVEAIEKILSSVYASGHDLLAEFTIRKPAAPLWDTSGIGTSIHVERKDYMRSVLFIRQHGAPYLKEFSISKLRSMVTSFLTGNFWYIRNGEFQRRHDCSYAQQIPVMDKLALADALARSPLFQPRLELTLYPLTPVRVADDFESETFFLIKSSDLSADHIKNGIKPTEIDPTKFPPLVRWEGPRSPTDSWLGIRTPLPDLSHQMAGTILGAIALTPLPRLRYSFSMRKVHGGRCTLTNTCTVSGDDDPHTPPLMSDIVLSTADHAWMQILDVLLNSNDKASRSKIRSLQYFYRAWFLDEHERFPILCMALDSLVAADHGHTKAAVKFVRDTISAEINEDRLRLLMRLRGAVIHGAAPDVYNSDSYEKYHLDYETDPIHDLEVVVAKCLRAFIFGNTLKHHPDPYAKVIADAQASGRFPKNFSEGWIISEDI